MPPIFSLSLSLWGRSHSRVNGQGAGGVLPIGLFPLSALGLPCLRSGSGGQGRQCLAGPSVLRDGCLVPVQVSSLPLLRYRRRYDAPGVLASGSGLAASACSCACGRCLRIALGPGAGFPFVSLPRGRVV